MGRGARAERQSEARISTPVMATAIRSIGTVDARRFIITISPPTILTPSAVSAARPFKSTWRARAWTPMAAGVSIDQEAGGLPAYLERAVSRRSDRHRLAGRVGATATGTLWMRPRVSLVSPHRPCDGLSDHRRLTSPVLHGTWELTKPSCAMQCPGHGALPAFASDRPDRISVEIRSPP